MALAIDWDGGQKSSYLKPPPKEGCVSDSTWQPEGGLAGALLGGSSRWLSLYSGQLMDGTPEL